MKYFSIILFLSGLAFLMLTLAFGGLSIYWARRLHDTGMYYRSLLLTISYLPWMAIVAWLNSELEIPLVWEFPVAGVWSLAMILPYCYLCRFGQVKQIPELVNSGKFGILSVIAITTSLLSFCYSAVL